LEKNAPAIAVAGEGVADPLAVLQPRAATGELPIGLRTQNLNNQGENAMKRHWIWAALVAAGVAFGGVAASYQRTAAQSPAQPMADHFGRAAPDDQTTNADIVAQLKDLKDQLKDLTDQVKSLNNQFQTGSAKVTVVMNPGR
jgi:hypothetical protein